MHRRRLLRLTAWALIAAVTGCARRSGGAGTVGSASDIPVSTPPRPEPEQGTKPPPEPRLEPDPPPDSTLEPDPAPEQTPEPEPEPAPKADPEPAPEGPAEPVRVEVLCREALGLAAAASGGRPHTIRTLTVHHTSVELAANRDAPARLRAHQRHHQAQGWPDVAYHYAVDLTGNLYELRDVGLVGDTFTDYDPAGHFLVVCEGDYDRQRPTDELLRGVAELLAWGSLRFGVPLDTVAGHRDHAPTRCPGDHLQAQLGALRHEAARIAGAGVETELVCGDDAVARVAAVEAT